jgi:hypothetical protein
MGKVRQAQPLLLAALGESERATGPICAVPDWLKAKWQLSAWSCPHPAALNVRPEIA